VDDDHLEIDFPKNTGKAWIFTELKFFPAINLVPQNGTLIPTIPSKQIIFY